MIDETTDLDACFSTDDFAEEVEIGGNTINAIFTKPTDTVDMLTGKVIALRPTLDVKSSDMSGIQRGATVTVRGVNYTIEEIHRVGTGISTLYLKT